MLVIDANLDLSSVYEKYYAIPISLKIPMIVVITKIDMIVGKDRIPQIMNFLKRELNLKLVLVDKKFTLDHLSNIAVNMMP
jgi:GTPase